MANFITGGRIIISIVLLFCQALSPVFCGLYVLAGLTDMIDGAVARKTGKVSSFGARLDTAADFVFAAVCLMEITKRVKTHFSRPLIFFPQPSDRILSLVWFIPIT